MEQITSRSNSLLARVRRVVRDRDFRRQNQIYLGDGVKLLEEAVRWHAPVTDVVLTDPGPGLVLPEHARCVQVSREIMASLSPMRAPQGVLFLCAQPELTPPPVLEGRRYLVLDGLQDPGNVGTIWRAADAFGADALLLTGGCADPYNWKSVRATMGAAFRLPVWEAEYEELFTLLRRSGLPLLATALREDAVDLRQLEQGRCAVAIGSEGHGISEALLAQCARTFKIPMEPTCESLNAAAAAAVVLWELYR